MYFFTHAKHTWSIQDSVIIFNTPVENVTGMCKDPGIAASYVTFISRPENPSEQTIIATHKRTELKVSY